MQKMPKCQNDIFTGMGVRSRMVTNSYIGGKYWNGFRGSNLDDSRSVDSSDRRSGMVFAEDVGGWR